jgi:N-methylhydantoinase B
VRDEAPIGDLFTELEMQVRARAAEPRIKVVRFYCPACAGCLTTDVVTDRLESAPALVAGRV